LQSLPTRFTVKSLKAYTQEEYIKIAVEILERQEGTDIDIGVLIAEAVMI
jgi:hypothetical protein